MESVEELCDHIALINKSNKILDGPLNEIKRQYKSNTYEIGIKANELNLEQELKEKFTVFPANFKTLDGELKLNLKIDESSSPNQLLSFLTTKGEITHFVEVIPSANDIFIQAVNNHIV